MSSKKNHAKESAQKKGTAPAAEPQGPFALEDLKTVYLSVKDITGKTIRASFDELMNTKEGQQAIATFYVRRMLRATGFVTGAPMPKNVAVMMCKLIETFSGSLRRQSKGKEAEAAE